MRKILVLQLVFILFAGFSSGPARADLYAAQQAFRKHDYERAFVLFRGVAELGNREAQENLAAMYVNGEGVKRDNVLGYAWAKLAREQGGSDAMQSIIDQLEPHLNDGARRRGAEIRAQFGPDALRASLLPVVVTGPRPVSACSFRTAPRSDDYYPFAAVEKGLSGNVMVEFTVQPDGRAHSVRVLYATPPMLFDESARSVILMSTFKPQVVNEVAVPCVMRSWVKFESRKKAAINSDEIGEKFAATKAKAEAGDPEAQYVTAVVMMNRKDINSERDTPMPWLVKAAQAGLPSAQFLVGAYTLSGDMVERDPAKGVAWLRKAAAGGHAQAQVRLANYLLSAPADDATLKEARDLLESAVKADDLEAKFRLAALLAASPDESARDPARALILMAEIGNLVSYDPTSYDVRAAAYAAKGNFVMAEKIQKTGVNRARSLGWATAPQEERLARYRAKQPWSGMLFVW